MVNKQYQVVWTKRSQHHMKAAHKYTSLFSPQNILKVVEDIVTSLNKAINNPEFYSPDKYKTECDET